MTTRHIKSTDNECKLENAFNTRYTGYMTSINNMEPHVYTKTKQFQYMYVFFFENRISKFILFFKKDCLNL